MADNRAYFDFPSNAKVIDEEGTAFRPWQQWFNRINAICQANVFSGTTAARPVDGLWIGRRYFDTTLGKPVYIKSVNPSVWVDGVGTVC